MRVKMATGNSEKLEGARLSRAILVEDIYGHSSFVISISKCAWIQPVYLKQLGLNFGDNPKHFTQIYLIYTIYLLYTLILLHLLKKVLHK